MQAGDSNLALTAAPLCTREDRSRLFARILKVQLRLSLEQTDYG